MSKVKLNILGLSNSNSQSGAYALILSEEGADVRLPIIIGSFEAQSIALRLENLEPPRPLTHDLFLNFSKAFSIELIEVFIHRLEEGVFYSRLLCKQADKELEVDARTSDAVALAIRFEAPIYTTREILDRAGIILDSSEEENEPKSIKDENDWSGKTLEELNQLLLDAVEREAYELASKIRDEINKRKAS